jgi:flagellar assembly protein FliH
MTSSSDRRPAAVLRGVDEDALVPARLWSDLRATPFTRSHGVDPRLVDPVLESVVAEAVAAAEAQARQDGWGTGYADGLAAGRRDAEEQAAVTAARLEAERVAREQQRDEQLAAALSRLAEAAAQLSARVAPAEAEVERRAAALAVELAEVLVGHHVTVGDCAAADAVERALRLVEPHAQVVVRLHPDDLATLPLPHPVPSVTLLADPAIERGGCVADAGARHIDARIGPAVARLRELVGR